MVHIEVNAKPDSQWVTRAKRATKTVVGKVEKGGNYSKYLSNKSDFWGKLRNWLMGFTAGKPKCWYSESINLGFQIQVEHFRPKANAQPLTNYNRDEYVPPERPSDTLENEYGKPFPEVLLTGHKGYYWLAFDWQNYTLAAGIPNGSYKSDFFPLLPSSEVKLHHNDAIDIINEKPLLLDPRIKADTMLIDFNDLGFAFAKQPRTYIDPLTQQEIEYTQETHPVEWENRYRARVTIVLYGLNYTQFREARVTKWRWAERQLSELDTVAKLIVQKSDQDTLVYLRQKLVNIENELREAIQHHAEFAGTVRAVLRSNPGNRVAQKLLAELP